MTEKASSVISMMKVAALTIGVVGAISSLAVFPYRVDQNEKTIHKNNEMVWQAINDIRAKRDIDHEILVRIDERLKRIDPMFLKNNARPNPIN